LQNKNGARIAPHGANVSERIGALHAAH